MAIKTTYAKVGTILLFQRIFNELNPGLRKGLIIMSLFLTSFTANSQYLETFGTANKGYNVSCMNDLSGVNWTLTPWDPSGTCRNEPFPGITDNRDPSDYLETKASGVLEGIDTDEEVCWESPLINISAAGTISLAVDLTWAGFDVDVVAGTCMGDYIKVTYSINGGAYTMVPNQFGGNACATVAYPNSAPGGPFTSSGTVSQSGLSGNTIKVRVCMSMNANAEMVTIDNVSIPQAGVSLNCSQPVLTAAVKNIVCNGPNSGSIDLSVSGGVSPYTYAWSNGPTTQDISGLAVGSYTVTVTDAASCSSTGTFAVASTPLGQSGATTPAYCGGTNGSVDLTVTGGNPGFTYLWSNGSTTQDITAAAGSNLVTVTDSSMPACTSTASYSVSSIATGPYSETFSTPDRGYLLNLINNFLGVNWTLTPWAAEPPIGAGRDIGDAFATTAGGKLEGSDFDSEVCWDSPPISTSGAGTYQFSTDLTWTGMDEEDYIHVKYSINDAAYITVGNTFGGGAGTIQYASPSVDQNGSATVTVPGLSGNKLEIRVCFLSNSQADVLSMDNVTIPQTVSLCFGPMITATTTNVLCNSASTGAINITVTGGTAPYTYNWGGGVMTEDRTGLAAGMYTVTVTDASSNTTTYTATISQPTSAPSVTANQTNVLCFGAATGAIDITPAGGTAGYTYDWGGGITSQDRTGLAAGMYTVTVTDANGCTTTYSTTITQPASGLMLSTVVTNPCPGNSNGAIDLTVSGGSPGYTYLWSNSEMTQDLVGLVPDTYSVVVTDNNSCTNTTSATVNAENGYVSISNGNYTDPATWLNGCVPPSTIPAGTTVTINHDIVNDGIVCNNGTIMSTGTFTNNGMYKGSGTFTGNFINNGTVSPGN